MRTATSRAPVADIRSVRLGQRLAQADVARRAGVDLSALKRWERGLELPPPDAIHRLADILGLSAGTLERAQREFLEVATPGEGYTTALVGENGVLRRQTEPAPDKKKVLDLFCGSGGFSYGFEQTDQFAVTAGIDLLPDRVGTFRANHGTAASIIGDIREFPIDQLGDEALGPDIVIGGPPCQGFSSIRPFRMCTIGDPRNNLFEHYALIVDRLRPKWFVLENVVGLLSHGGGKVLPALLEAFKQAGYRTDWRVINAAQYGLPQNRERLVVVGSRDGRQFEWPTPTNYVEHRSMAGRHARRVHADPLFVELDPPVTVMQAIHDLPELAAGESATHYRDDVVPTPYERRMRQRCEHLRLHEATAHSAKMLEIIRHAGDNISAIPAGLVKSGFSSCYSRLAPDQPSVTLTVNFVHPASNKCIHPYQNRALTPREGARLQGFPDAFAFHGSRSQIVKQIGNAVPPLLGQVLAEALLEQW